MTQKRINVAPAGEPADADSFDPGGNEGDVLTKTAPPVPGAPPGFRWAKATADLLALTKYPTGFEDRTQSTLTFNDATRTLTITPVGPSYSIWYHGTKLIKSAPASIVWPNVEGLGAAYFDAAGVIQFTNNVATLNSVFGGNGIPIAALYWDATNLQTIRRIEERHDTSLPPAVHIYLHQYVSTVLQSGGQFSGFTIVGGGGDAAVDAQFAVGDSVIADEDINWPIANGAPQTLSPLVQCPVYYLSGAGAGVWRQKTADVFPMIYSGTAGYVGGSGRLPWNQFTGGAWQLTEVTNSNFVLVHYFATTDLRFPIIGIQGQADYATVALARAGANRELNTIKNVASLLSTEKRALGSVIYQSAAAYTNAPKAKVVLTDTSENYVNWTTTPVFTGVILA
jgi:hypothetical protein